ncbi:MAG: hypothetical protein V1807_02510 [Patescibacteria group bacterium]
MASWSPKQGGIKSKEAVRFRKFNKIKWGAISVTSISLVLFVVLTCSYIVIINVVSTKGAQIHTLDLTKKGLAAENERLAVEAARLQSLAVIEKGATEQIEIGDNGQPTGRTKPATESSTDQIEPANQTTYVPKMIQIGSLTYLEDTSGPLAQK